MANGDVAAGLGWKTNAGTDDRRNGWDALNYALDRAAEQRLQIRDNILPAINQPIFAVKKNTAAFGTDGPGWKAIPSDAWTAPVINSGFTTWSGGQLTIKTGGVYRITGHVQFAGDRATAEYQVVKNSTQADKNVCVKNGNEGVGTTATGLTRLVAGDVLLPLIKAVRNDAPGNGSTVDNQPFSLTLDVEWVRG